MSDDSPNQAIDIREWVDKARGTPYHRERQATEVFLVAISATSEYSDKLYLKGGLLMGLVHGSPRQTADIDLTAALEPTHEEIRVLQEQLNRSLRRTPALIGYPDLVCRIQSMKPQPKRNHFEDAQCPGLQVTVAYAERDSRDHQHLERGNCSDVLQVDVSYREPVHAVELLRLNPDSSISAYSTTDVIAEKFRALLQQVSRGYPRRRQDVYDIAFLIRHTLPNDAEKAEILDALLEKARSRDIEPQPDSLCDPDVRKRAAEDWDSLELEIADLPPFDQEYELVEQLYRSLPWDSEHLNRG